ncbi:hypothetical protein RBA41_33195 [Massilia sp. CCM 9210]|uniref:hypothetical protein n=1 Tax=Massilia scottii TaxID=3057166 RepID=UPI0027965CBD|nr:hypothetical protein [Massilia sp. CCM 9210]MDQ1818166.1 hypothetical protein [Massilia sp. CCM 9210]
MPRITAQHLARAIETLRTMTMERKTALADDVFQQQPTLFGSFLVLTRFGVSFEKMEFLLERLFVCFLAMRQSGIQWPRITEDELDKQAARFSATVSFADGMGPALAGQSLSEYTTGHPEPHLLAYVTTEMTQWLATVQPEESDKYVMLAAMNIVNCIAHVPLHVVSR